MSEKWWFVAHIDRDFTNGLYGEGYRLYRYNNSKYDIVKKINIKNDIVEITTDLDKTIKFNNKPCISKFNQILNDPWEKWDKSYGLYEGENRCDYKPWFIEMDKDVDGLKLYV